MLLYLWVARVKETNRAWGETQGTNVSRNWLPPTAWRSKEEKLYFQSRGVLEGSLAGTVLREGGSCSETMTGARNSGRNTVIFLSFTPLISCQCLLSNPRRCQGPGLGEAVQRDQPPPWGTQQGGGDGSGEANTIVSIPWKNPEGFATDYRIVTLHYPWPFWLCWLHRYRAWSTHFPAHWDGTWLSPAPLPCPSIVNPKRSGQMTAALSRIGCGLPSALVGSSGH